MYFFVNLVLLNSVGHPEHLTNEICNKSSLGRSCELYEFDYQQ